MTTAAYEAARGKVIEGFRSMSRISRVGVPVFRRRHTIVEERTNLEVVRPYDRRTRANGTIRGTAVTKARVGTSDDT